MAFSDLVDQAPPPSRNGMPCSVGKLLGSLPDKEQEGLRSILSNDAWTNPQINAAILAEGHTVSETQIGKHRRNQCRCARAAGA